MARWCLGVLVFCTAAILTASPVRAQDIVLYASDVTSVQGNWSKQSAQSGAGGQDVASADNGGAVVSSPLAAPANYFEATFNAPSFTTYHVWFRLRASGDSKWNDSVWVQFSDASTPAGSSVYRFNTSSALLVNLEPCSNCGVSGWGWQDGAYWLSQNSSVMFGASGSHTIRVQTREDGVQIDQIVLSPSTYLSRAPGQQTNDTTILSKGGASTPSSSTPFSGSPVSLPGTVSAQNFDSGGEGVAYHDTTSGNTGGAYRPTDVDLQTSTDGGNNIGWVDGGEWVNYTVNVGAAGSYTLQARVASATGGSMRVGFSSNGASVPISVPNTGGWQTWTTVSLPVTLAAGRQVLTVSFSTTGTNFNALTVTSASTTLSGGSSSQASPYGGTAWPIPGTIEAEDYDSGGEGIAYHDSTGGNSGGQYRNNDVDVEVSSEGGFDIGWAAPSDWLNYSVNVASAGGYTVQLRVASSNGGSIRVGFNGPSSVWTPVSIAATGGWQAWTTVNLPVTLGAGRQTMTLLFETGGVNLNFVKVVAGSTSAPSSPSPPTSTGNRLRVMTWNIQHGTTASGAYDPAAQARFIASQNPDVVALQEVETWDENQPDRYKTLLQQLTGQTWSVVWAPVVNGGPTEGNVLLTRLPVVSSGTYQMHATSDWTELYANRSAAEMTVQVNGVNVSVFSTHLDYYNTAHRTIQEDQLMAWASTFAGPRLVAGDFNSWWGEYWITRMTQSYSDTWVDVTGNTDLGYTVNGAVRFDYIFRSFSGSSRATPIGCTTPGTSLSDHYPVVADFTIQ